MRTSMTPIFTTLLVLLFALFIVSPATPANAIALPDFAANGLTLRSTEAATAGQLDLTRLTKRKGGKVSKPSKGKKHISKGVIAAIVIVVVIVIILIAVLLFLRARKAKKAKMAPMTTQ